MGENEKEVTVGSMDLLNSMQLTEKTAGLDGASKLMLHNIEVASFILKNVVPEYQTLNEKTSDFDFAFSAKNLQVPESHNVPA